jgi:epoxyqueuosine reductase QueG
MEARETLESSLREAGVSRFGFLSGDDLRLACADMSPEARSRCGVDGSGGAIAAALAYGPGAEPAAPAVGDTERVAGVSGRLARLAAFARSNWYAELLARLKAASAAARAALEAARPEAARPEAARPPSAKEGWRCFVNSRLPEKRLALAAGLGELGRHGLVMVPGSGSAVILGIIVLPSSMAWLLEAAPAARAARPPLSRACASCSACVEACPTQALRGDGTLVREACIQHWSALPGPLPEAVEAAWGDRLYGCDTCQEACPLFHPDPAASTARGVLGPGLPAERFSIAGEAEIAALIRGSALDMGWISTQALRRNAGLACRSFDSGPPADLE